MDNTHENSNAHPQRKRSSRWITALLWVLAVVLMLGSAVYQRITGPTHPLRGSVTLSDSEVVNYKLLRTEETVRDARISIPKGNYGAVLHWRRFKTSEEYTAVQMEHDAETETLYAELPAQPMAGKLEYYITTVNDEYGAPIRIPAEDEVVIRFKGVVPPWALIPHIFFMFFGVLWGFRTLLEALAGRLGIRWMAWTTFILLSIGGMFLGPLVQLHAFGAWWTGVPFGWDLTDNKTLVMWLCWLIAVLFIGWKRGAVKQIARWITIAAAVVMLAVYLVPHSMYGSELDYDKLEEGADPVDAIGQG